MKTEKSPPAVTGRYMVLYLKNDGHVSPVCRHEDRELLQRTIDNSDDKGRYCIVDMNDKENVFDGLENLFDNRK